MRSMESMAISCAATANSLRLRLGTSPRPRLRTSQLCAELFLAALLFSAPSISGSRPTKASESSYNQDLRRATTSEGLSNADLAWHALNTYGWKCAEVVSSGEQNEEGFYVITCANGTQLRVYPRENQHPRITNIDGTYENQSN